MKTFLVYATEDSTLIGNRQRVYDDWKVGDTIISNGRETKIVAIYFDTWDSGDKSLYGYWVAPNQNNNQ